MVITRFAPSPTGYLHIGNLRAALMNYLIARKAGGQFVLRIDDTDAERSKQEYIDGIQTDLEWLGLPWDRIEYQSKRLDRYHAAADELRMKERFYEAFETPTELDLKRKKQLNMGRPPVYDRAALALSAAEKDAMRQERGAGVWRFLLDQTRIEWADMILGPLSIDAASVSDPVLIRADGQFLYTLASVCDDVDFGITHVVRGSDHVTNTATQIQIMNALGHDAPAFGHHSLLVGPQGEALSKRLGTMALRDLRASGIEPMAILSHMARLGSNQNAMIFDSLDALAEGFDIGTFGAAPTKFDQADLPDVTARYLQRCVLSEVEEAFVAANIPQEMREALWTAIKDNVATRADIARWWAIFSQGADPLIEDEDHVFVKTAMELLPQGPLDENSWGAWTSAVKSATGRKGKSLFMPLRKALTGQAHGPDMTLVLPLLQKIKARDI